MQGTIRSEEFDDIYFSPENGWDETNHVFLKGNNLASRLGAPRHFTVGETGFGTGLNFFAAWELFDRVKKAGQRFTFLSFEKHPLSAAQIKEALVPWHERIGARLERFLSWYELIVPGEHILHVADDVTLRLVIGDINDTIAGVQANVDAWFLDGFAPAKNPAMWSDEVFKHIGRLSAGGATAATFSSAGVVKRGLQSAGFEIEKVQGYGSKRDMVVGRNQFPRSVNDSVQKIAIIGGGIAGCAAAYEAYRAGHAVTLFEAEGALALRASGNKTGLYNPRFRKLWDAEAQLYSNGFCHAARFYKHLEGIEYNRTGTLHLLTDAEKEARMRAMNTAWGWPETHARILNAQEASDIAGVTLPVGALYLPEGGSVSPPLLCEALTKNIEKRFNEKLEVLPEGFDAVVIANAYAAVKLLPELVDKIHTVRGQIGFADANATSTKLKTNLCYGGYLAPAMNGVHAVGSTYQKWLEDEEVRSEDNAEIITKLEEAVPALAGLKIKEARAALRTTSKTHLPLHGHIYTPMRDNLYISIAHGSHGLTTAPFLAYNLLINNN